MDATDGERRRKRRRLNSGEGVDADPSDIIYSAPEFITEYMTEVTDGAATGRNVYRTYASNNFPGDLAKDLPAGALQRFFANLHRGPMNTDAAVFAHVMHAQFAKLSKGVKQDVPDIQPSDIMRTTLFDHPTEETMLYQLELMTFRLALQVASNMAVSDVGAPSGQQIDGDMGRLYCLFVETVRKLTQAKQRIASTPHGTDGS